MTDSAAPISPPPPAPPARSRPYLRLLMLIPALAMLGVGLYFQFNVPEGGEVNAVELTTKAGMVGQAAEAVANVTPTSPDLYLKIFAATGDLTLPTYKDTPVGNGLMWKLPRTFQLGQIQRVEVWDHHTFWKDKPLDRITLHGWSIDGQLYHVELLGKKIEPPKWSIPVAAVGGAVTLLVLLRFVWDQVI
jgi:hypothetical protein